jgi:hypothetical protein
LTPEERAGDSPGPNLDADLRGEPVSKPSSSSLALRIVSWVAGSGFSIVVFAYTALIAMNLLTLLFGAPGIYAMLSSTHYGVLLSFIIYDTPGTIGGLVGVAIIFGLLTFLRELVQGRAAFFSLRPLGFVLISILSGIGATALWNYCCNAGGGMPSGSSGIDFAATSCLIVYASSDFIRLLSGRKGAVRGSDQWFASNVLPLFYAPVIAIFLVYVLFVQPISVPTTAYNWRVHEFAFLIACGATSFSEILEWVGWRFPSRRLSLPEEGERAQGPLNSSLSQKNAFFPESS